MEAEQTLHSLCAASPKEEKPHYFHGLIIGLPDQKPRHFRKVTRSERFPQVLVDIATIAFEANRCFGISLQVKKASYVVPGEMIAKPFEEALLEDDKYVETDPLEPEPAPATGT